MVEDVVDLVTGIDLVSVALAVPEGSRNELVDVAWPGTPVVVVPAAASVGLLLAAVASGDEPAVAVLAPDVPDLPPLLLGKLFSALSGARAAQVAVCPAEGGGLVAAAARLPVAPWLTATDVALDDLDALASIAAAAPPRGLSVVPGWHRIRDDADLARLDDGLEGWEATRAALDR